MRDTIHVYVFSPGLEVLHTAASATTPMTRRHWSVEEGEQGTKRRR